MQKVIIIICFLISYNALSQQSADAIWLRHTCGYTNGVNLLGGNVWGDAACADRFGNSFNSGYFSGNWFTMDTVIEMNTNRFYINKYNSSGKRLWTAKAKGTTINSIMTSSRMECDDFGNVYICGTFGVDDSVYMAPYWYPVGSGYIAKYDSNGNNVWCRYTPKTSTTALTFNDMSIANGYIYACGIMNYGTASFGTFNFTTTQPQNGVIVKLDLNGNVLLAELLDTAVTNEIHGIEVSKHTNNVYLVGQYLNNKLTIDGMTIPEVTDATNSFIVKMNSSFVAKWLKNGYTHIQYGTGSGVWGTGVKCLKSVELDQFDNVYAVGNGNGDTTRYGNLFFNHIMTGSYHQEVYLVKYDSNGSVKWLKNGKSAENDYVHDVMTDKWGNSILSVWSGKNALGKFIFDSDSIAIWHGGLIKYDPNGNVIFAKQLQENRSITQLALGTDSTFFATGNGIAYSKPYDTINVTGCENTTNGTLADNKMIMVKFFDNTSVIVNSVKEIQRPFVINVYPNPANEHLFFKATKSNEQYFLKIFDMYGGVVYSGSFVNEAYVNTSQLAGGMYIYQLRDTKNQIVSNRFIKQ